ncbi:hypothetical protein FI667_g8359, partial [Globisporangium splendens]
MLRVQRTSSDRARLSPNQQLPPSSASAPSPPSSSQHVALAPRPFAQQPLVDNMTISGATTPLDSMDGHLHSQHHLMTDAMESPRLLIRKGKKIKGAPGTSGGGPGRKMLKMEVTQLQHTVDSMQQQVDAATCEIQQLRNMVGLMTRQNAHPVAGTEEQMPPPAAVEDEGPVPCTITPMMDIYQQNEFTTFAPSTRNGGNAGEDDEDEDNEAFYNKVEEFCDAYPLFFEN